MVVSFIRFVYSKTPKRSWAFFMMFSLADSWELGDDGNDVGVAGLFQYRHFARCE